MHINIHIYIYICNVLQIRSGKSGDEDEYGWGFEIVESGNGEERYPFLWGSANCFSSDNLSDVSVYYLKMFISSHALVLVCLLEKVRYHTHQYTKVMVRLQNEALKS